MRNRLLGMLRWQRTLHAAAYQPERVEVSLVVNSSARQSRPDVREQNTHARLLPTPCIRPKALTRQAPRNSCTYLYKTKVMRCGWRQPVLHVAVLSEFSRRFGWGRARTATRSPYCSGCLVPIPNHINYYWAAFRSWLTLAGALRALCPLDEGVQTQLPCQGRTSDYVSTNLLSVPSGGVLWVCIWVPLVRSGQATGPLVTATALVVLSVVGHVASTLLVA